MYHYMYANVWHAVVISRKRGTARSRQVSIKLGLSLIVAHYEEMRGFTLELTGKHHSKANGHS